MAPRYAPETDRAKGLAEGTYTTLRQAHGNKVDGSPDEYSNCTPNGESYGDSDSSDSY